ncbi:MAG: 16S rRNA (uracil(1498)-N(3))-methyltransferase [Bdellovibrionales bacterium]
MSHTWPRLYVDTPLQEGSDVILTAEQSHYLLQVMRRQQDDPVRLFNGLDGEWLARIGEIPRSKKKGITLKITKNYRIQAPEPALTLFAAPIKRAHFEFLVQKATELGVKAIQPILTTHTQIKDINPTRLSMIAIEAAEQSERLSIPVIRDTLPLKKVISDWNPTIRPLLCAEFGQASPIGDALIKLSHQESVPTGIFTGPEGGFTQEEMELFQTLPDIMPLRLGPRILRADTAAIAAVTCWQALCGDWRKNELS